MKIQIESVRSFHQIGQRSNQEDARCPDADRSEPSQRFFLVCDGVGGSEAGEVASHTVCEAFARALAKTDLQHTDFSNADFAQALDAAYNALDKVDNNRGSDMATTLTFAAFHKSGCTLAHIGDSRIYQLRPNMGIVYRSDDHSLVNQMVHSGVITPEQAVTHPQRNIITRCMAPLAEDQSRSPATVYRSDDVQKGDWFLLCTDGVLHNMDDDDIEQLILEHDNADDIIATMAQQSKDSPDNNTATLIHIADVEHDKDTQQHFDETSKQPCNTTIDPQSCDTRQHQGQHTSIEEIVSIKTPPKDKKLMNRLRRIFKG